MAQKPSPEVSRMSRSTPINLFLFIAARQKRETSKGSEARNRWKLSALRGSEPRASDGTCERLEGRDALSNLVYRHIDVDRRADHGGDPPNGRVPNRAGGARKSAR